MRLRHLIPAAAAALVLLPAAPAMAEDDWYFHKVPKPAGVNGPDAHEVIVTLADRSKRVIDCRTERDPLCIGRGDLLVENVERLRAMGARRIALHIHEHDGPKSEFRDTAGYDMLHEYWVPATDDQPTRWQITQSYAYQSHAFVHGDRTSLSINEMRAVIERDREELSIAAVKSKIKKAKAKAKRKAAPR